MHISAVAGTGGFRGPPPLNRPTSRNPGSALIWHIFLKIFRTLWIVYDRIDILLLCILNLDIFWAGGHIYGGLARLGMGIASFFHGGGGRPGWKWKFGRAKCLTQRLKATLIRVMLGHGGTPSSLLSALDCAGNSWTPPPPSSTPLLYAYS